MCINKTLYNRTTSNQYNLYFILPTRNFPPYKRLPFLVIVISLLSKYYQNVHREKSQDFSSNFQSKSKTSFNSMKSVIIMSAVAFSSSSPHPEPFNQIVWHPFFSAGTISFE